MRVPQGKLHLLGKSAGFDKTAGVGAEVGGVHSSDASGWLGADGLDGGTRAYLEAWRRDSACQQASQRSEGNGEGSAKAGITTPERIRKLQRVLYCKAKAEPGYRFWSLYGDILRGEVLEYALRLVSRNGGASGVDGQTIESINATPHGRQQWLDAVQQEIKAKTYRPSPVRRVKISKSNGGQRLLGIPTVKDRVVQMAATLVLAPIFEADFHPRSFGFRPRRSAHQAIEEIVQALRDGRREVLDADLSKYFDTIPHGQLLQQVARRVRDGSVLRLIKLWLRAPVMEEDRDGTRRVKPNRCGTPQGGVISPLLANLYLNALDWAVNERTAEKAVMVRYADDLVILCRKGQGTSLLERLRRWLEIRRLKLNEEKTRLVSSQEGFDFLGFRVRWRPSRRTGRWYAHVEPSAKSQQRLREAVRGKLNHWTHWKSDREAVTQLNRLLRGWSGYFHFQNSSGVMSALREWVQNRLRRWLWRRHNCRRGLWDGYPTPMLYERYGLFALPRHAGWKR